MPKTKSWGIGFIIKELNGRRIIWRQNVFSCSRTLASFGWSALPLLAQTVVESVVGIPGIKVSHRNVKAFSLQFLQIKNASLITKIATTSFSFKQLQSSLNLKRNTVTVVSRVTTPLIQVRFSLAICSIFVFFPCLNVF